MQGYDAEGNKFSSLNGIHFNWEATTRVDGAGIMGSMLGVQSLFNLI